MYVFFGNDETRTCVHQSSIHTHTTDPHTNPSPSVSPLRCVAAAAAVPLQHRTHDSAPRAVIVVAATAIGYRSRRICCRHVPIANVVVVRLLQLRRHRARAPRDMWCRRLNLSPIPLGASFFSYERGKRRKCPVFCRCY